MSDLAIRDQSEVMEAVITAGDLAKLSAADRVRYYAETCRSMNLNPFTKPFDYLYINNKLVLYATRGATDQLRKIHGVSLEIVSRETVGDIYIVTARATLPDGRRDEEIGAVSIATLRGEALANAFMKASTKAKRRVTLAIVGLGWLDETEIGSIPNARAVRVDEDGLIRERHDPEGVRLAFERADRDNDAAHRSTRAVDTATGEIREAADDAAPGADGWETPEPAATGPVHAELSELLDMREAGMVPGDMDFRIRNFVAEISAVDAAMAKRMAMPRVDAAPTQQLDWLIERREKWAVSPRNPNRVAG